MPAPHSPPPPAPPATPGGGWLALKIPPPLVCLAIAAAMYALARWAPLPFAPSPAWPPPPSLWSARGLQWGVAALLALTGLLVAGAARWAFYRYGTTANPLCPQASACIVQTGVYRFSRNPMYLGMALCLAAWAVWLAHPLALLGVLAFVAWMHFFQIRPEESILQSRFGTPYNAYLARVRRWL